VVPFGDILVVSFDDILHRSPDVKFSSEFKLSFNALIVLALSFKKEILRAKKVKNQIKYIIKIFSSFPDVLLLLNHNL